MKPKGIDHALKDVDLGARPKRLHGKRDGRRTEKDGLTALERRFLDYALTHDCSLTEAYKQASGCAQKSASVGASRALARPEVAAALVTAARRRVAGASLSAARTLERLTSSARSEYVQLDAAKTVLDRAGVSHMPGEPDRPGVRINIVLGETAGSFAPDRPRVALPNGKTLISVVGDGAPVYSTDGRSEEMP